MVGSWIDIYPAGMVLFATQDEEGSVQEAIKWCKENDLDQEKVKILRTKKKDPSDVEMVLVIKK